VGDEELDDKGLENKGLENKVLENKGLENKGLEDKGKEDKYWMTQLEGMKLEERDWRSRDVGPICGRQGIRGQRIGGQGITNLWETMD